MSSAKDSGESHSLGTTNLQLPQTGTTPRASSRLFGRFLSLESVAIDHDFFELRWDSSLAVRMFADIFARGTIARYEAVVLLR